MREINFCVCGERLYSVCALKAELAWIQSSRREGILPYYYKAPALLGCHVCGVLRSDVFTTPHFWSSGPDFLLEVVLKFDLFMRSWGFMIMCCVASFLVLGPYLSLSFKNTSRWVLGHLLVLFLWKMNYLLHFSPRTQSTALSLE